LYKLRDMAKALDQEKSECITIEQYNQELDEAEAEFEEGEVVTHDEVLKQIRKW
jgi:predicted transcriptional regulator